MSQTMGSRSRLFRAFAQKASANVEENKKVPAPEKMAKGNDDLGQVEVEQVMQQEQKPAEVSHPIQGSISSPITLSRQILNAVFQVCRGLGRLIAAYLVWVMVQTILERLAPGLPSEIAANLTAVWRTICPLELPTDAGFFQQAVVPALRGMERIWQAIASALPFLG